MKVTILTRRRRRAKKMDHTNININIVVVPACIFLSGRRLVETLDFLTISVESLPAGGMIAPCIQSKRCASKKRFATDYVS